MSVKSGIVKIQPIEGYTPIGPSQYFTYRRYIHPFENVDWYKSFFNVIETVATTTGDLPKSDHITNGYVEASPLNAITRAENHLWAMVGIMNIYFNGTLVESISSNLGELDTVLKRLSHGEGYNIDSDYSNFNKSYLERYYDKDRPKKEYQFRPNASKIWKAGQLLGGLELRIELIIHNDYLNRGLDVGFGQLPFTQSDGNAVVTAAATDKLTQPTVNSNSYTLHSLDLYLHITKNKVFSPLNTVYPYIFSTWQMDRYPLVNGQDFTIQLNLRKGIRKFGFVFQINNVNNNNNNSVTDFTGVNKSAYTRGTGATANGVDTNTFILTNNQAVKLKSYELRYGKNRLPDHPLIQKYDTDENTLAKQQYIRHVLTAKIFNDVGDENKVNALSYRGPIYFEEFKYPDNDNQYLEMSLSFHSNTSNLVMLYFYEFETSINCVYDGTGTVNQVIPTF